MEPKTIHVTAVEGRHATLFTPDGTPRAARFAGRGPGPEFAILPRGEPIPDHPEHRRALAHGDLVLVDPKDVAPEPEPAAAAAATPSPAPQAEVTT